MKVQYRTAVAYDGSAYHGWQAQPNDRTVEGELTRAAATILDCSEDEVTVQGASRTDAGVHALGQVAHIAYDVERERSTWDFVRGLNALTDEDICVVFVEPAPEGFHARHSSRGKLYRYEIWNHRFPHPLRRHRTWRVGRKLDLDAMRRGAEKLVGEHDFEGFRASTCAAMTTVREMTRVEIVDQSPLVIIEIEGTAFLKYMVRAMAGTLVEIANGQKEPAIIDRVLETCDRTIAGITAPPQGLTLVEIFYPDHPWEHDTPTLGGPYM